ncbi:hypothetical protein HSX11_02635 [Oxalobacteraceae bacterium]|nr:hypothetical protein [Oxalobacteraceae bacterium]
MTKTEMLAIASQEAYDGYGVSDEVGISYFMKFIPRLSKFDFGTVLKYQMQSYPHRYVLDFILSSSTLWLNLSAAAWLEILNSPDVRTDTSRTNDQVGQFADVEFLSRYVGVDALGFLIDSMNASMSDKKYALDYFSKFPYGLAPSQLDDEDLDGVYFVSKELLISLQETLCHDFGFSRVECNEENANEYIDDLRNRLELG